MAWGRRPSPIGAKRRTGDFYGDIGFGRGGDCAGGPIGGAIGALAGRAFDSAVLLKPKGRRGPRLQDLAVQTSTYGSQIPKLFGAMRVAGTVIWATDLQETKNKNGGGKGQPSVTTYSYSASFAVALSARRVLSIGRIWADGNLLRGVAGDFKTELGAFRLHDGGADQAVDPLMAAAEGIGVTPAHRGIAYAVFEDLALADFGNRIPSLTFEVVADTGEVSTGSIASALSGGVLSGAGGMVSGYAASGDDVASALQPLVEAQGLVLEGLRLDHPEAAEMVTQGALAARINGGVLAPVKASRDPAAGVPVRLSVRHYEPERDYQAGVQTAVRPGVGRVAASVELPAAISASAAKGLAQARLGDAWRGRSGMEVMCGWDALVHRPGTIVTVEGIAGLWRVAAREWEAMGVRLELRGWRSGSAVSVEASAGSVVRAPDAPHGATVLMIADLPVLTDSAPAEPVVVVAAAGASAGWRRAALFTVEAGSGAVVPFGRTAPAAVMGIVVVPPGEGSCASFDLVSWMDVQLLSAGDSLAGADEAAMLRGTNMCLVGRELIQFGSVSALGSGLFRLRRLLRGRRGTDHAMADHAEGEPFLLLDAERLAAVPQPGGHSHVIAVGIGDATPASAERDIAGEALMPLVPVHLTVEADGSGGREVRWIRRSRSGWGWSDGVDAPLGEEAERYRVEVRTEETVVRSAEVVEPLWTYDAAMAAADGAAGYAGALSIAVRQIGTHRIGRTATMAL
ncbi:phage tail protein [Sphingobium sp. SCG-1]|uniref:phage tail protein n=1 Tax=Sphingobium sp. SCG-1 TaxID=2072936 RepID=UPI001CB8EF83|nr:phage tail protein [Sphingobium sp. SCG-1]